MRKTGQERIREQVALYIKQLKEGSIVQLFLLSFVPTADWNAS